MGKKKMMRSVAKILSFIAAVICLFLGVVPTSSGYNGSHIVFFSLSVIFGFSFAIMERRVKDSNP